MIDFIDLEWSDKDKKYYVFVGNKKLNKTRAILTNDIKTLVRGLQKTIKELKEQE